MVLSRLLRTVDRGVLSQHPRAKQRSSATGFDRYPEIFAFCAERYREGGLEGRSILSFGCASGEECASLVRHIPRAPIVGADINPVALVRARRRVGSARVRIVYASDRNLEESAPYGMVFCLSVLCRFTGEAEPTAQCPYDFSDFEETLRRLDRLIAPGGLLIIYNASFRFCDSALYSRYRALDVPGLTESGFVDKYGPDGLRLADQSYSECVFQKRG